MKKAFVLFILICVSITVTHAQLADSVKAYLIRDFIRAKAYTQSYMDAMPADKYGYRPTDSVRTFAQQLLHMVDGTYFLGNMATGIQHPRRDYEHMKDQGKDSVAAAVNASYDYMIDALQKTDPGTFLSQVKMGNFSFTKLQWYNKVFEHQTHHRGQTTIYIRMVGLKPPQERLF
jgi:uncharacterized damage-inducible protein DinB